MNDQIERTNYGQLPLDRRGDASPEAMIQFLRLMPFFTLGKNPENTYAVDLTILPDTRTLSTQTLNWLDASRGYNWLTGRSAVEMWNAWSGKGCGQLYYPLDQTLTRAGLRFGYAAPLGDQYEIGQLTPTIALPLRRNVQVADLVEIPLLPNVFTTIIPALEPVHVTQTHLQHIVTETIVSQREQLSPPTLFSPDVVKPNSPAALDLKRLFDTTAITMIHLQENFQPWTLGGKTIRGQMRTHQERKSLASNTVTEITRSSDGHQYTRDEIENCQFMGVMNMYNEATTNIVEITLDTIQRHFLMRQPVDLLVWMAAGDANPSVLLSDIGLSPIVLNRDVSQTLGEAVDMAVERADVQFRADILEVCKVAQNIAYGYYTWITNTGEFTKQVRNQLFGMLLSIMASWPAALVRYWDNNYYGPSAKFLRYHQPVGKFVVDA
jgi:hypothetical protein